MGPALDRWGAPPVCTNLVQQANHLIFEITHTTVYRYSRAIFLEPHTIRLVPRTGADQRLLQFESSIEPPADGVTRMLDAEGNTILQAWFSDLTDCLSITCRSRVETLRENSFDYLLHPQACQLPFSYDAQTKDLLGASLERAALGATDKVKAFAHSIMKQADYQTVTFLDSLNLTLYTDWAVVHREEGAPWRAEKTLSAMKGSCRDLCVLFIDACRACGVAARFVSGYQEGDTDQQDRHLHAWAEVFIPGAGWRGYDPTHGLAVADRHVALSASAYAELAAPVTGAFRGTGASATLETQLDLRVRPPTPPVQQQQQQQQC